MPAKLKPGDTAPDFTLPSTTGQNVHLAEELRKNKAVVVMFICNHCPYVKAYIPRLVNLQKEFAGKAAIIGICSNDADTYPNDSFDNMKKAASEWGLNFAYLRDEDQSVAQAYGAERTPEIFALDAQGVCRYEGGIDDNHKEEARVTQRPLRDALAALVAGKPVAQPQSYAIGCTIKWKK
jgi:peroxiredoxin